MCNIAEDIIHFSLKTKEYIYQLEDINTIARSILNELDFKTVLFYGDMGTGKTTLIKALLHALESEDRISSPTFSIVNEYNIPNDKVYHFDFYRIESIEEVYDFGIEDYFDSSNWIFIEWPDRINELLPNNANVIEISLNNDHSRSLKLKDNKINLTETHAENSP